MLRWIDDPEGEDIARWEYQVREVLEPGQGNWSGWSSAGGSSARSHTVRGLTNGVRHHFQVQGLTAAGVTELTWPTPRDGSVVQATPQASLPLPPNEAPSKPEGEPAVRIAEHTTDTGEDYTSLDPEGTAIQWSLTGDAAAHLQVTAQGRLIFRDPAPDFEDPKDKDKNRVYEVEVVASDGELSSPPLAVTVTVTNVNEPPVITGEASQSVPENTKPVGTYTATDPEGDPFTWSNTGEDADDFVIEDGALSFNLPPDYESPSDAGGNNEYQVTVTATEGMLAGQLTAWGLSPHKMRGLVGRSCNVRVKRYKNVL